MLEWPIDLWVFGVEICELYECEVLFSFYGIGVGAASCSSSGPFSVVCEAVWGSRQLKAESVTDDAFLFVLTVPRSDIISFGTPCICFDDMAGDVSSAVADSTVNRQPSFQATRTEGRYRLIL